MNQDLICRVCRTQFFIHPDCEETDICDLCAQTELSDVRALAEDMYKALANIDTTFSNRFLDRMEALDLLKEYRKSL